MSEFGANLLSDIAQEFNKRIKRDKKLKQIANRVRDGTADYAQAGEYAVRVGELLAESLQGNTKNLAFISKEVAAEILGPMLQYDHELVTEVTNAVQANMNAAAGVGIAVQTPEIDTNRIDGLINKAASYSTAQESQWVLKEPVVNYSQAIVDQSIRDNAKAAHKVGLETYIVREAEPGACKWCRALEGTYEYKGNGSNIPRDVYRRHEFCRCVLTYANGKQRQNVWDHSQVWSADDAEGQKKAYERAQSQRQEQTRRRAEENKTRAEDIERIMGIEGWDAKTASIWRNKNIDAIAQAGGAENYLNASDAQRKVWKQAGEVQYIMNHTKWTERQAYIWWGNNRTAINSHGVRKALRDFIS